MNNIYWCKWPTFEKQFKKWVKIMKQDSHFFSHFFRVFDHYKKKQHQTHLLFTIKKYLIPKTLDWRSKWILIIQEIFCISIGVFFLVFLLGPLECNAPIFYVTKMLARFDSNLQLNGNHYHNQLVVFLLIFQSFKSGKKIQVKNCHVEGLNVS